MKTLAIYNIKGGVGKTSAAVNLAYHSARDGFRTLLWDLDPQSSATFFLRVTPKIKGGGKTLLKKKSSAEKQIKGTNFENFDLLPGAFSYRKLDRLLDRAKNPSKLFRGLLESLGDYDHLVIDCAPGISIVSETIFRVVDLVLVPTIPTPLCLRTAEQLDRFLDKKTLLRGQVYAFFSMVDRRRALHRRLTEGKLQMPIPLFLTGIPYSSFVEQMGIHRSPIAVYAGKSAAAGAYDDLWQEVREKMAD